MLGAATFVTSLPLLPRLCRSTTADPDLVGRVRNLRGAMSRITRQVDVALTEPELFQVTQEFPVNRAPAVGCRTRDFSFNVQDIPELVIEEFPTWAALPRPPVLPAFQPLFSAGRNCSCSQPPLLHTLGEEPCPGAKTRSTRVQPLRVGHRMMSEKMEQTHGTQTSKPGNDQATRRPPSPASLASERPRSRKSKGTRGRRDVVRYAATVSFIPLA